MFGLGFGELVLIFVIALIFIGPKKLPELAKGLGKGIREFQNAAKGFTDQMQNNEDSTHKKTADAAPQLEEKTSAPTADSVPEDKETHHS